MKRARVAPTWAPCEYSTGRPVAHASGCGASLQLAFPACVCVAHASGLRSRLAKKAIRRIAPRACAPALRRRQSGGLRYGLALPACEEGNPEDCTTGLRSRLAKTAIRRIAPRACAPGLRRRQSGGLHHGLAFPACEDGNPEDCTTGLRFRLAKTAIRRIAPRPCVSALRRRQSGGLHHGLAFPACEDGNPEDCATGLRHTRQHCKPRPIHA